MWPTETALGSADRPRRLRATDAPPAFFVVDTLIDENDGDYSAGDVSLREAIEAANASAGAETITFAPSLVSGGPATIFSFTASWRSASH